MNSYVEISQSTAKELINEHDAVHCKYLDKKIVKGMTIDDIHVIFELDNHVYSFLACYYKDEKVIKFFHYDVTRVEGPYIKCLQLDEQSEKKYLN